MFQASHGYSENVLNTLETTFKLKADKDIFCGKGGFGTGSIRSFEGRYCSSELGARIAFKVCPASKQFDSAHGLFDVTLFNKNHTKCGAKIITTLNITNMLDLARQIIKNDTELEKYSPATVCAFITTVNPRLGANCAIR